MTMSRVALQLPLLAGKSGRVVVPHDPGASRLFQLVTHQSEPAMPRDRPRLPDEDLEAIRSWILAGGSLAAVPAANSDDEGAGRFNGRDMRLTDVHGELISEILA
jgi:hypothetical protein